MKLKKLFAPVLAAGLVLGATSAMAGLKICGHNLGQSEPLTCNGTAMPKPIPADGCATLPVVGSNVPWGAIYVDLGYKTHGTCTIGNVSTPIGSADIDLHENGSWISKATGTISNINVVDKNSYSVDTNPPLQGGSVTSGNIEIDITKK